MKPDLSLIDGLRAFIDMAVVSGDQASQDRLASLLQDVAQAIVNENFLLPANLPHAPGERALPVALRDYLRLDAPQVTGDATQG